MTEAAQKRPGPGTVPQVCAKNSNDPSGGLIASPIPVVADEIAADAGTVPQVCAKNSNDPSGGLIASPIPVVADEIAADAEDLAPRKELHFASVDWHWRGIDRFGREAWRAAAVELDHREPGIGSHRVPRAVLGDSGNVRAPGPVQGVRTTRKYQIVGDFVAFPIHVCRNLVRERPAWPQVAELHVMGGGANP